MRDKQASLTAATVAFAASLRWYTSDQNAKLQAELMRNISWRHMPLPLWLFAQFILCNGFISKAFLRLWISIQGSTNAINGLWMRKSYMEKQVRDFLDRHDAKNNKQKNLQVLIVAAGYDTLAWRLALEYPTVNFIELDHPATGMAKVTALRKVFSERLKKGSNMTYVNNAYDSTVMPSSLYFCHRAIGKGITLKEALENSIVNTDATDAKALKLSQNIPTAIVVEGLTFYLNEEENRDMFQQLGDLFGCPGSIIAFDFFHLDKYGRPTNSNTKNTSSLLSSWVTTFFKYKVRVFGEPFRWGITPESLPDFFRGTGWSLVPSKKTFGAFGGSLEYTVMMGIEYEATVEWIGR